MEYEILKARESAERTLGFVIDDETAEEVLAYAKRKCELNHKPDEYLPLLYENELTDYFMRLAINLRGEMNRVRCVHEVAMRPQMPELSRASGRSHLQRLRRRHRAGGRVR